MESPTPGVIAQLRGRPTRKRYKAAMVFVDNHSGLSFVHIQMTTGAQETVEGKIGFEKYSQTYGVKVKHYHAKNGVFADNLFKQAVLEENQMLSFCGVNAHWQNGVAQRRIHKLQDMTCTMLLHAASRWPGAITANLWQLAMRMANAIHSEAPKLKQKDNTKAGKTALELFSQTQVAPNPQLWHTFSTPVYVLDNALQAGKKIHKWSEWARVGIYVGQRALVLNKDTGLVSLQFHVKWT